MAKKSSEQGGQQEKKPRGRKAHKEARREANSGGANAPAEGSGRLRRGGGAEAGPAHSKKPEGHPDNQRRHGGPSKGNRANHRMFPMKGNR